MMKHGWWLMCGNQQLGLVLRKFTKGALHIVNLINVEEQKKALYKTVVVNLFC